VKSVSLKISLGPDARDLRFASTGGAGRLNKIDAAKSKRKNKITVKKW